MLSSAYQAVTLYENMLAMNEALLLGSLRQHELVEATEKLNEQLHAEITERRRIGSELIEAMVRKKPTSRNRISCPA